jgi:hypothetical protein
VSLRKNAAPSTPPSDKAKDHADRRIRAERLEHRSDFRGQVSRIAGEVVGEPPLDRRHQDIHHDGDDQPDE